MSESKKNLNQEESSEQKLSEVIHIRWDKLADL